VSNCKLWFSTGSLSFNEEREDMCGRPLGIRYHQSENALYFVSGHGLFKFDIEKEELVHLLDTNTTSPSLPSNTNPQTAPQELTMKSKFPDDLVLVSSHVGGGEEDGKGGREVVSEIYFSDVSFVHPLSKNRYEVSFDLVFSKQISHMLGAQWSSKWPVDEV